ncbi:bifunctional C97 family peptidase/thioredoxin family protein [Aspergillus lucknowensis]|uniref:Thioredoxin n=1 Tax=Aspergillus lucknowensis TaxID=176173 RepID=A0ABR4LKM8_9EURO
MDVELYVYDLSQGLARMYSLALTGTQMDAIYHTSLVFNNIEYYFGHGIQTARPGSTHHGQPIERIHMGKSELPFEVIEEYLQSLSSIYTPESYDLFLHNCNNFTQDLAMFLLGKSIPGHIRNLPQTFLSTPLGQMLKPQIEGALRGVTQARGPGLPGPPVVQPPQNKVHIVTNLGELDARLSSASKSCAVIFFTSATCPPCKMVYPLYDELAEEAGPKAVLIKVDISIAHDVGMRYSVRATPTFMTFLRGEKLDQWSGADPGKLRGNVRLLLEMAHPTHRHRQLHLPSFQRTLTSYVMYKKTPPLEKLAQKLQPHDKEPILLSILDFIKRRADSKSAADHPLPKELPSFATYLQQTYHSISTENRFALVDLARLLFIDPRVAGYFAEDTTHKTVLTLLNAEAESEASNLPYNLRIVTLQLACNLFNTPLYTEHLSSTSSTANRLRTALLNLLPSALLDTHSNLRVVAASLAYNLSALNHNARFSGSPEPLTEEEQVELTASVAEAITQESGSAEALHGLLFALGLLVYEAPVDGAVLDLCRALGVKEVVEGKVKDGGGVDGAEKGSGALFREVGALLARGL